MLTSTTYPKIIKIGEGVLSLYIHSIVLCGMTKDKQFKETQENFKETQENS